ncbi:GUN4 domain-containing protein [uncultured Nostoc sp.]|uniref:GUN4 domain-containing protein n=1 Tax=uncultured Nostoc sp. TaxID=340711 RepID=UPI0026392F6A|nr:GUN4 domain-containing protein [uncultured Nostoc sp.]
MQEPMFDVFLAHNSLDKPLVRAIAQKLKQYQLEPWLDEEQILGGDTILEKVYSGITQSRTGAFFIGRNGLGNFQENIELYTVINWFVRQQGKSKSFRVIPILLPGVTNIPDKIAHLAIWRWIQFNSLNDESALQDLIQSIIRSEAPFEISLINPPPRRQFLKWVGWGSLGLGISVVGREIWNQLHQSVPTNTKVAQTATPETQPTNSISRREQQGERNPLESERGIDYTTLDGLLKAGKWQEADKETYGVMIQAYGKKDDDFLTSDELLNFPCTDLRTINHLWIKYSNGYFGFSVQKEIYLSVGGQADGKYNPEAWEKFGDHVGWRVNSKWFFMVENKTYTDFTDTSQLKGYLPTTKDNGRLPLLGTLSVGFLFKDKSSLGTRISIIASRLESCNISYIKSLF